MAGLPKQPRRGLCLCQLGLMLKSSRWGLWTQSFVARKRKVTTWPLVQVASGPKVVSVMPFVTSFSTAQATAFS